MSVRVPPFPGVIVIERAALPPTITVPDVRPRVDLDVRTTRALTKIEAHRVHETVSRVRVRFGISLESLAVIQKDENTFALIAVFQAPERDSGRPSPLRFETLFTPEEEALTDPTRFAELVRMMLRDAMLHEVDESIRVDNVLAFDPHRFVDDEGPSY